MATPPPIDLTVRAGLTSAAPSGIAAAELLAIVDTTLRELHAGAPGLPAVTLASALDRDLGLDSLARTELLARTERAFGVQLPDDTLQRADTVADLLDATRRAQGRPGGPVGAMPSAPDRPPAAAVPAGLARPDPAQATTLLDLLDGHLQAHPDRTQLSCLADDGTAVALSHRQMAATAAAIAAGLQSAGVQPRDCVAIMLPTSPEYFGSFLGILRAGAIPVPIYPPARASQLEEIGRAHV